MAKNYSITFKSLRAGTTYVVNIGGGTGAAVPLKGGAQPFTTEEDGDEDMFKPIRTQSGYIRIMDDGRDYNGNVIDATMGANWWQDLMPATDTSRPVTLTANGTVVWQGFMQAQNFGGVLYGNPQEREFPVQCPLTILSTQQPTTQDIQIRSFAYLINLIVTIPATLSSDAVGFDYIKVQGGMDAQQWLLKKFDWQNLLSDSSNNDITPRYNMFEALEDICRFWGWTARTVGRTLYLTCTDDQVEQTWLEMTALELATMAGGSTAGTTSGTFATKALTGDIFASTDNDETTMRGPNKAVVKADCNEQDTVTQFAPGTVELQMEGISPGYEWVQGENDLTGYFTTQRLASFDSLTLKGTATSDGGFYRRQIYSEGDQQEAEVCDIFAFSSRYISGNDPMISIQTKEVMAFSGGSLSFSGSVWIGEKKWNWSDGNDRIIARIGIGMTRASAVWYYQTLDLSRILDYGWSNTEQEISLLVSSGSIQGVVSRNRDPDEIPENYRTIQAIPIDDNISGYVFVDFLGMCHEWTEDQDSFEIGDFAIHFSRDSVYIPTSAGEPRPRTMTKKRVSTKEYTSSNPANVENAQNVDLIYASDNNMEYGYGLVLNANGSFMATAKYNGNTSDEHPEQHLANRITSYWQTSRRKLTPELRTDVVGDFTPQQYVTLENQTGHFSPLAVARQWRDDVTIVSLVEMP